MGIWERSPAGIKIAMRSTGLLEGLARALPDFSPKDHAGLPYCAHREVVDERLGGPAGLVAAREMLVKRVP